MRALSRTWTWAAGVVVVLAFSPASAWGDTAIGGKAGTVGFGLEISTSLSSSVVLRGGVAAFERSQTFDTSSIDYDGDLELLQASLLFDWHPGGGAFRLTVGAVGNENSLVGTASLAQVAEEEFGVDPEILALLDLGVVRAEVEIEPIGPYVGFGWGDALGGSGSRLRFSFDLGVIYQGSPTATAEVDSAVLDAFPDFRPIVEAFLEQEVRELEEDAEDYEYYPVVTLGLSYRF